MDPQDPVTPQDPTLAGAPSGGKGQPANKPEIQAPGEGQAPSNPTPAAPPAGLVVKQGSKTEREMALERDLKSRETRIAELEDENRTLKTPPPQPKPKDPAPEKKSWLRGVVDDVI